MATYNAFLFAADTDGTVQSINTGTSDNGVAIFYELETQELEMGNRATTKSIRDSIVINSENASGSHIQLTEDDKDPINVDIRLGNEVAVSSSLLLRFHYLTLKWFGSALGKTPIFKGFHFEAVADEGIQNG
jgi:hypothetical protein